MQDSMPGISGQRSQPPLPSIIYTKHQPCCRSALELVASLEQHAVRLFLAVLLAEQLGQGEGPAVSEPELVQGLAFLAMMFNAAYVVSVWASACVFSTGGSRQRGNGCSGTSLGRSLRFGQEAALASCVCAC